MALNAIQKAAVRHDVSNHFAPPETRLDDLKWCEVMHIEPRTLRYWRKRDDYVAALEAAIKEAEETADPFALYARQWALEEAVTHYKKAKSGTAEKRHSLKLILDQTQHVADAGDVVDYSDLPDADLVNIVLNRGVSPLGMTEQEIKAIAKGEPCTSSSDS